MVLSLKSFSYSFAFAYRVIFFYREPQYLSGNIDRFSDNFSHILFYVLQNFNRFTLIPCLLSNRNDFGFPNGNTYDFKGTGNGVVFVAF